MLITMCKSCGSENLHTEILPPGSPHYARKKCGNCGAQACFVPKPQNENKTRNAKQTVKDVSRFHGIETDSACFFCLRTLAQLGAGEKLEVDHIVELQQGGPDAVENMQVLCTACHKQKMLFRTYFNWHINGKDTVQPQMSLFDFEPNTPQP